MPEMRIREVRLPELRLPEMSRDDIARVIDDARDEIAKVELPDLTKVDLSKVELPRIDLSRIDLSKVDVPRALAAASLVGRRAPRRWPFVVGSAIVVAATTAFVLSQPQVRTRLQDLARTARMRIDERRAEMASRRQDAQAFDAAVAVPIQPSAFADDAPAEGSPFDGTAGLPEGLGAEQVSMPPAEDPARA